MQKYKISAGSDYEAVLYLSDGKSPEIAELYRDGKLIAKSEFGGAGTTKIHKHSAKALIDALHDIIFEYGRSR